MGESKEQGLWLACTRGDLDTVRALANDPAVSVNWSGLEKEDTPLHRACRFGHLEIVKALLALSTIEVNRGNEEMPVHSSIACENGHKEVVSLLLADPRIDPNRPENDQSTPLWHASQRGHLVVVQHLLVSGREIDTKVISTFNSKTAPEQGREAGTADKEDNETEDNFQKRRTNGPLCADLIDEYENDVVAVRNRLQRLPGLREYFTGHLFALVVFYSDSFAVINERSARIDTRRFFKIVSRLPLEIQMIICNQAFGSPRDTILSRDSEPGFKCLARATTWQ